MKKQWLNPELKNLELNATEAGGIRIEKLTELLSTAVPDGQGDMYRWVCCCGKTSTDTLPWWPDVNIFDSSEKAQAAGDAHAASSDCLGCSA